MSAIAGIDQALWDIKGKELGRPVYELLGGRCRDRMQTYTWVGGDDPADECAQIEALVARGWTTFKLNGCGRLKRIDGAAAVDRVVERVSLIRARFGSRVDFGLDFHGRVSVPMAAVPASEGGLRGRRARCFIEEPVLPEHWEHYAAASRRSRRSRSPRARAACSAASTSSACSSAAGSR